MKGLQWSYNLFSYQVMEPKRTYSIIVSTLIRKIIKARPSRLSCCSSDLNKVFVTSRLWGRLGNTRPSSEKCSVANFDA